MMKTTRQLMIGSAFLLLLGACSSTSSIRQALKDNPDLIMDVIRDNPEKFAEASSNAGRKARQIAAEKEEAAAKAEFDKAMTDPLKPEIGDDRPVRGDRKAPITLVEYSDFQCPYCQRGYRTVEELRKKYGEKILFVFKNFPLDFHPLAMPAALAFEAVAMQSAEKAYKFHDEIFNHQQEFSSAGEKYLDKVVKKLGINMAKYKKDVASETVKNQVKADIQEGQKFGMNGTPGFIVAGVPLRGAYPAKNFEVIIETKLKARDVSSAPAASGPTKEN